MASSSLLPLLVLLLTSQTFLYVKSDETLISHLCNKTAEPEICSNCLNSDPSSKTADSKGLALTAANCAKNDTTSMFESISQLSKKTPTDSPLKTILGDCVYNTSVALRLYDGVIFCINDQDYATAKEIISEYVMPFSDSCVNEFDRQPNVVVPSDILSETQAVNKAAKVTMGILNNI